MANCKHCGADLPDKVEVCPNCGQRNTDYVDESYLDSLLSSVSSSDSKKEKQSIPTERVIKNSAVKKQPEKSPEIEKETSDDFLNEDDSDLDGYNIFGDISENEIDQMISKELNSSIEDNSNVDELHSDSSETDGKKLTQDNDDHIETESSLHENEEDSFVMPFNTDFQENNTTVSNLDNQDSITKPEDDIFAIQEPSAEEEQASAEDDIFAIQEPSEPETMEPEATESESMEPDLNNLDSFTIDNKDSESADSESKQAPDMDILSDEDIVALDDLFHDFSDNASEDDASQGLQQDLAKEMEGFDEENGAKRKAQPGEQKSLLTKLFANVPVDPSKIKPEPTPEELEAKKQAQAEEKKKKNEEKKAAAAEKKEAAKKAKEEKAKQAQLAKEEKKAKKLEEAKLILEEMEDTRINRLGASLIFIIFGLIAIVVIVGSNLFTYAISIRNAEKSFGMALNNDVKYYTDAYNQIYGLDLKTEDEELENKIMTVMFVNKQLNSYNSFVAMNDYTSALDSLFKGLLRYNKYTVIASDMGLDVQDDLDYVKSRILIEMENKYGITRDMADNVLAIINEPSDEYQAALEYSKTLYELSEKYKEAE